MYGKYKHTVDPKGRLFVPSKLREELGDAFYVTLGLDHCLSVYTEAGWQGILDKYLSLIHISGDFAGASRPRDGLCRDGCGVRRAHHSGELRCV